MFYFKSIKSRQFLSVIISVIIVEPKLFNILSKIDLLSTLCDLESYALTTNVIIDLTNSFPIFATKFLNTGIALIVDHISCEI